MKQPSGQVKEFLDEYIKTGLIRDSAIKAGYSKKYAKKAGDSILGRKYVRAYLQKVHSLALERSVATSTDVMNFFTKAMNGEIKDQFGLDATLSDRIKAAQELAKRTVDIENQTKEAPQIQITLKWSD